MHTNDGTLHEQCIVILVTYTIYLTRFFAKCLKMFVHVSLKIFISVCTLPSIGDLHVPQPCIAAGYGSLIDSDEDRGSQIDEDIGNNNT